MDIIIAVQKKSEEKQKSELKKMKSNKVFVLYFSCCIFCVVLFVLYFLCYIVLYKLNTCYINWMRVIILLCYIVLNLFYLILYLPQFWYYFWCIQTFRSAWIITFKHSSKYYGLLGLRTHPGTPMAQFRVRRQTDGRTLYYRKSEEILR